MARVTIGNIAVVQAGQTNPYREPFICGKERSEAIGRFFRKLDTSGYEFWFAPVGGGARRLSSPEDTDVDADEVDFIWDAEGREKRRR